MAIAPIDLQTIFTQVEKVGKAQAAAKEGQTLQQAMQGAHIQKKTEDEIRQVNQAQDTGEGADKISDNTRRHQEGSQNNKRKKEEEAEEEKKQAILKNPYLGNKIDISL